jgi:hypothetical protein
MPAWKAASISANASSSVSPWPKKSGAEPIPPKFPQPSAIRATASLPGPELPPGQLIGPGVDDLVLALERVQQGDERGGPLVRRGRLDQGLGHELAHLRLVAGILRRPGPGGEDAQGPPVPGAQHPAGRQPLVEHGPQVLAQRPDHRGRLAALPGDQGLQRRVENLVSGR